jgi:hypothetical protein
MVVWDDHERVEVALLHTLRRLFPSTGVGGNDGRGYRRGVRRRL